MIKLAASLLTSAALLTGAAHASVVTEAGDAGQTAATAQGAAGATRIEGSLIDLGDEEADVDFYRIVIEDVDGFAVEVLADLSEDNDAELLLFNEDFDFVLQDDDDGVGLLPAFVAGELSGATAGTYYLAITLYAVLTTEGGVLTIDPSPFQTGEYALLLDGVAPVPLPAAAWLFGAGIAGVAAARRRGAKA